MAPKAMITADALCLGMAAVYSFFGLTLLAAPSFFWGPSSKLCYWTVMDESGIWFGRCVGLWMAAITLSPYYAGISKSALVKMYLPVNIGLLGLFLQAAFVLKTTVPPPGIQELTPT